MTKPTPQPTPGQLRVAPAIAARKRASQERLATRLRAAGWTVHAPGAGCGAAILREVVYTNPCQENPVGQCVTPGHNHP
jgi:hypothetical protein